MRSILIPPVCRPTVLFDKSFLESLNLDQSVWFDNLFEANICRVFFEETLTDLCKSFEDGRDPKRYVQNIARKCPPSGVVNVHHEILVISELIGDNVVIMDGEIPVASSRKSESGIPIIDVPIEAEAFAKWRQGQFSEIDLDCAREWRLDRENMNLKPTAENLRRRGIGGKSYENIAEAKSDSAQFLAKCHPRDCLIMAMENIPISYHEKVLERWEQSGRRPLSLFAPYAAYILEVQDFFITAMAAHHISTDRNAHLMDLAYLYYLPFCNIFVSGDKEQIKWAKLFVRDDQIVIRGAELKNDLIRLNIHYRRSTHETKKNRTISFAEAPPKDDSFLVTKLWDRYSPGWREAFPAELRKDIESGLLEKLTNESPLI
jgi:hypothetical protein